MIELSNLILNSAVTPDPAIAESEATESTELLLKADEIDQDDEIVMDPNSFVLLMAQVLATNSVHSTHSVNPTKTEDSQIAQTAEMQQELVEIDAEALSQKSAQDTKTNTIPQAQAQTQAQVDLENNIAMTWINSESYTPPQLATPLAEHEAQMPVEFDRILTEQEIIPEALVKEMTKLTNKAEELFTAPISMDVMPAVKEASAVSQNGSTRSFAENLLQSVQMMNPASSAPTVSLPTLTLATASHDLEIKQSQEINDLPQNLGSLTSAVQYDQQNSIASPVMKSLSIPVDMNSPQWAEKFSDHIVWLGQQSIKSALIRIHPEDLGPIEINIKVVKDTAAVTINSHSSHVCSIVDQSIPRLREMMADQGLNLGEVHISSDPNSQNSSQQNNNSEQGIANNTEDEVLLTPLNKKPLKGLIDYFA